jgi:hypothetical protein
MNSQFNSVQMGRGYNGNNIGNNVGGSQPQYGHSNMTQSHQNTHVGQHQQHYGGTNTNDRHPQQQMNSQVCIYHLI